MFFFLKVVQYSQTKDKIMKIKGIFETFEPKNVLSSLSVCEKRQRYVSLMSFVIFEEGIAFISLLSQTFTSEDIANDDLLGLYVPVTRILLEISPNSFEFNLNEIVGNFEELEVPGLTHPKFLQGYIDEETYLEYETSISVSRFENFTHLGQMVHEIGKKMLKERDKRNMKVLSLEESLDWALQNELYERAARIKKEIEREKK